MKILVADDHSLFRDGIISLLEAAGFDVVGQAGNGQMAVDETIRLRPDLVLMDISMPQLSGLEALRQIKAALPETKVVMLTVSEEDSVLFEAVKSGAHGYLLKDLNTREFLEMVEGLQHGEAAITRKTVSRLMESLSTSDHHRRDVAEELTQREIDVLQLAGKGLTNKALAQQLCISENTVKYHIRKIFQKLDAQNRTEAVAYAMRAGLINPEGKV